MYYLWCHLIFLGGSDGRKQFPVDAKTGSVSCATGDCLLEVNSLSLRGFDCERLFETLQSSPDLCLLKVARTRSLDVLAQNEPPEQVKCRHLHIYQVTFLMSSSWFPGRVKSQVLCKSTVGNERNFREFSLNGRAPVKGNFEGN